MMSLWDTRWETAVREQYVIGEFGDARLKKRERICTPEWSPGKASACGNWAEVGRVKSVLGDFWAMPASPWMH
jgi:hypothetical protein